MPLVDSEAIAQIEYHEDASTLFVRFTSGEWYAYLGVAASLHAEFLAAESHGRFFQDHLRGPYRHIGPLPPGDLSTDNDPHSGRR